jgi:hypothetical protein
VRFAIMETVTERDHHARIVTRDHCAELRQRRRRIERRQQYTTPGEAGSLFQMQIGNDQQLLLFPEQRAGDVGGEGHSGNRRRSGTRSVASCRSSHLALNLNPAASPL